MDAIRVIEYKDSTREAIQSANAWLQYISINIDLFHTTGEHATVNRIFLQKIP